MGSRGRVVDGRGIRSDERGGGRGPGRVWRVRRVLGRGLEVGPSVRRIDLSGESRAGSRGADGELVGIPSRRRGCRGFVPLEEPAMEVDRMAGTFLRRGRLGTTFFSALLLPAAAGD